MEHPNLFIVKSTQVSDQQINPVCTNRNPLDIFTEKVCQLPTTLDWWSRPPFPSLFCSPTFWSFIDSLSMVDRDAMDATVKLQRDNARLS